jgi:hypothetical protein
VDEHELERLIGQALTRLPGPRAPRTLLPRVMAAVAQAASRPWYARAWRTWPIGGQLASIAGCLLLVAAGAMSLPSIETFVVAHPVPIVPRVGVWFAGVGARAAALQAAVEVVWRVVIAPVATYAVIPVLLMCVASVACGAALGRLAFGGRTQS